MTINKENVEKRHLAYQEIKCQLREREKQERFIKKMKTEKGIREFKKCTYQARLKQSKIQSLAIKDSIVNTEKFRDRPNEVKFIFEEDMVEKMISLGTDKKINSSKCRSKKTMFKSMIEFLEDKSENRNSKFDLKTQIIGELKKYKTRKDSKFVNRSVKFLHCQSTPDILEIQTPPTNKMI